MPDPTGPQVYSAFDVVLQDMGRENEPIVKIKIIKAVAEEIKEHLERAGASVTLTGLTDVQPT